jgi:hypothetical protein
MKTRAMRIWIGSGTLALIALLPLSAAAEVFVDARAGAIGYGPGYGIDIGVNTSNDTNLRASFTNTGRNWPIRYDGIDWESDYTLRTVSGLLDWRPDSGIFHLTFGILYTAKNDREFTATVTDINGTPYSGTLTANLQFDRDWGPYLGAGWGNMGEKEKGFMWSLDVGFSYIGKFDVRLTSVPPASPADISATEEQLKSHLRFMQYLPMASAAIGWRF